MDAMARLCGHAAMASVRASFRKGCAMIHYRMHASPLGSLLLAATDRGLCGLYFEEHRHFNGPQGWQRMDDHPHLRLAAEQLDDYFAGRRREFALPLDLAGTPFQHKV